MDAYAALDSEQIDWQSASGKKNSAAITAAGHNEVSCLAKLEIADVASQTCTADPKGKTCIVARMARGREQGRFFHLRADPLAVSLLGALGRPKHKGCGCK